MKLLRDAKAVKMIGFQRKKTGFRVQERLYCGQNLESEIKKDKRA